MTGNVEGKDNKEEDKTENQAHSSDNVADGNEPFNTEVFPGGGIGKLGLCEQNNFGEDGKE